MYDYLIVGAGLFGSVFAYEMTKRGRKCLVIDKRSHIGGNCYTEEINGINVHKYGPHIFHTSKKDIWDYINRFAEFNSFINSPLAVFDDEIYNLPFNMNTFSKMWGIQKPEQAQKIIAEQTNKLDTANPKNLEEQAISLVGKDLYEKLIKGYTEKQWGRSCKELPSFIIKRLPLRFTYNNNYYNDRYQGIPIGGYTRIFEQLLSGSEVKLNTDYTDLKKSPLYKKIVYTGRLDALFDCRYGSLEYRSLRFETEVLDCKNYQGNAVINFTDSQVPYTRIIEHKHFEYGQQPTTVISREYPIKWNTDEEPYYPVNDEKNNELYKKYLNLVGRQNNLIIGGRLGEYKYYDMDKVIAKALDAARCER